MFLNAPPEQLSEGQRRHFEEYMRSGGNAIVVHRAAIVPPSAWPWYEKLVGRSFVNHPMVIQTAVITVADRRPTPPDCPSAGWSDEYYVTDNPYRVSISPVLNVMKPAAPS